ncbi:MAG: lysoplasmalogenase family protein [Syntrophomonas sp.]|nr:lysoplasmalogenase family protein [Syntrophomonas sp.]
MNNAQRILLATYLPFTLLILILSYFYYQSDIIASIKVVIVSALSLSAISMKKSCREQKIVALAFIFMAAGNFYFLVAINIGNCLPVSLIVGTACFLLAYLCLIAAFHKNARWGKMEYLVAILIFVIFLMVTVTLLPYIKDIMIIGLLIFGTVLCYMTWNAIGTVNRMYFKPKINKLIALSAGLIFASDIGVAYKMFYPLSTVSLIWLNGFVWGTFLIAWTFLAIFIGEDYPFSIGK